MNNATYMSNNPILSNSGVTGSFLLRINSKYKKYGEKNNQFTYDLVSSSACASVTSLSLLQFTMNRVFGNIYDGSDTLSFAGPDIIGLKTITVPAGQYTITSLVDTLNTLATAVFGPLELLFIWDATLDRVGITNNSGATRTVLWDLSPLAPYIGISTDFSISDGFTAYCQSPPQLQGPDQIFVESQILASGQCLDDPHATGGSIPLLGIIPCGDVPYGYTINYTVEELDQTVVMTNHGQPSQLKRIDISIVDKYGYLLDIPPTCYVDILFRVTYMPN